jgi:parallel beta-helix repeat protein
VKHFDALIKVILVITMLLVPAGIVQTSTSSSEDSMNTAQNQCIGYDSTQKLIEVRCESIHLTDIYNSLRDSSILSAEDDDKDSSYEDNPARVWTLNAGIVIKKEGGLIIDSSDTSWLKIMATPTIQVKKPANVTEDANYSDDTITVIQSTSKPNASSTNNITKIKNGTITVSKNNGDNPNGIHVHGSLKIDSVKITSWDPEKKDVIKFDYGKRPGEEHTKSDYDTAEPRAFIRVSKDATGTTNITNSEIAYLGYSCSRCAGLSYYGGEGSEIRNSNIHHLLKGFYSKNAAYITIDNNTFHNNYLYGIDPHTGSHDFVITNNLVYNNNASGIICSKHCFNLLIEGNEVYNNSGAARGIAFSINTTNSVAKNNYVHDQPRCISFNRDSNFNEVYNNDISNCKIGIYLSGTSSNLVHDNTISNTRDGINLKNLKNIINENKVVNSTRGIVYSANTSLAITDSNDTNIKMKYQSHYDTLVNITANNLFEDTVNIMTIKADSEKPTAKISHIE